MRKKTEDKGKVPDTEVFNEPINNGSHKDVSSITTSEVTMDDPSNPRPKPPKKSSKAKRPLICFFIFVLMYAALLLDSINEEEEQAEESNIHDTQPGGKEDTSFDIKLQVWIGSVDPFKKRIEAQIFFFPSPKILSKTQGGIDYKIMFDFGLTKEIYERGSTLKSVNMVIPISEGNPYIYPFETFTSEFDIQVMKLPSQEPVPISVNIMASAPAMWFDVHELEPDKPKSGNSTKKPSKVVLEQKGKPKPPVKGKALSKPGSGETQQEVGFSRFEVIISRPKNIILFSLFVIFLLWALTGAIVAMTIAIYVSEERPGAPYLGLGPALMFAMPNMRASQPGIPTIGILADVLGFIWNLALVSMSSVVIIGLWVGRAEKNDTKEKKETKKAQSSEIPIDTF